MRGEGRMDGDRVAALDILRLLAALSVVGFHYLFRGAAADGYLGVAYPEAAPYALYGYLGVDLFFIVSGFVIAWSAEGRDWRAFAVARAARLYPGFVLSMTVTFAVLALAARPEFPAGPAQYLANLTMLAPVFGQPFMDGVYWSIVLELVFYGWIALALAAGVFDRLRLELVAAWLALSAANEFLLHSGALRLLFLTEFGPFFAAGVLLHHIRARGRSHDALMLLAAAFLLSCNTLTVGRIWMLEHYGVAVPLAHLVLANAAIHALAAAAIWLPQPARSGALAITAGGLTYPLYLLHQNVGYVAIGWLSPAGGRWLAAIAVTAGMIALSWAIWRFAERPAQRRMRTVLSRAVGTISALVMRRRPGTAASRTQ